MKIIALLPVRNEAWILSACLSSLRPVVDEIIAVDDGSSDGSANLIESYGGRVLQCDGRPETGWAEFDIRQELLRLGRASEGTHFVCIDADEAITCGNRLRPLIECLRPGQKLSMQWVALWKSVAVYRDDESVWSHLFKDFVYCDDGHAAHDFAWLGVGRTPGKNADDCMVRVDPNTSCVLHFQFAAWNRFQMKQAWYRCCELMQAPGTARQINQKYAITLDSPNAGLREVPASWLQGLDIRPDVQHEATGWHFQALQDFFETYGMEFFEPLQIWEVPELASEFLRRVGRHPKPAQERGWRITNKAFQLGSDLLSRIHRSMRDHAEKPNWRG